MKQYFFDNNFSIKTSCLSYQYNLVVYLYIKDLQLDLVVKLLTDCIEIAS